MSTAGDHLLDLRVCPGCRYSLRGASGSGCPECGLAYDASMISWPAWRAAKEPRVWDGIGGAVFIVLVGLMISAVIARGSNPYALLVLGALALACGVGQWKWWRRWRRRRAGEGELVVTVDDAGVSLWGRTRRDFRWAELRCPRVGRVLGRNCVTFRRRGWRGLSGEVLVFEGDPEIARELDEEFQRRYRQAQSA